MNSLKTAVILAVLLAAAYWVYVTINNHGPAALPSGAGQGWSDPVDVQFPSTGGGTEAPPSPLNWPGTPAASGSQSAPSQSAPSRTAPAAGGTAPPFSAGTERAPYAAAPAGGGSQAELLPPPFPPEGYSSATAGSAEPQNVHPEGVAVASDLGGPSAVPPGGSRFEHVLEVAQGQLDQGALDEGLQTLSRSYGDAKLTPEQDRRLEKLLDQVAGTVIYSRQHLLEPPHQVRPGETLEQIAQSYHVPAGLLAKINGIRDPAHLQPGQELKVVRGPFSAVIDLDKYEMTLMLQGRYAGRFRIGVGRDCPKLEGVYEIKDKTVNPTYYGRDQVVDADDPRNPLGERWIGLGSPGSNPPQTARVGIHGTDNPLNVGATTEHGTICLGSHDAEDVYDILSIGSRVVIRR